MNDRELLELAAKAAGGILMPTTPGYPYWAKFGDGPRGPWDPLTDLSDALRLAVALQIKFRWHKALNQALAWPPLRREVKINAEDWGNDQVAASCRAITTAAAEIGRAMP